MFMLIQFLCGDGYMRL